MVATRVWKVKKVYFACSIRGGRSDADIYAEIVDYLKPRCELLTEIFADQKLTDQGMNKPSEDIWKIDTDWVRSADALIAEVSNPSLGVGYEIALAEQLNKEILCLYREQPGKKLSAMIDGSPHVQVVTYTTIKEATTTIDRFLATL